MARSRLRSRARVRGRARLGPRARVRVKNTAKGWEKAGIYSLATVANAPVFLIYNYLRGLLWCPGRRCQLRPVVCLRSTLTRHPLYRPISVQRCSDQRHSRPAHPLYRPISVQRCPDQRHTRPVRQTIRHHQPTRRLYTAHLRQGTPNILHAPVSWRWAYFAVALFRV